MISPAGLSGLLGAAITAVQRSPLPALHFSGNDLERVTGQCDGQPVHLILKRFRPDGDWVMRLTHDSQVREVALYRHGMYTRLLDRMVIPILAVARDGHSWATLMEDVGEWLVDRPRRSCEAQRSTAEVWTFIRHLALFHVQFLNDASLNDSALGLSALTDFITILSPQTVRREIAEGRSHLILERASAGWLVFEQIAPTEVVAGVQQLQREPTPLLHALAEMPQTLLHGDFKLANLGLRPAHPHPQTIWLDWQDATVGPPLLDLAYWLAVNPASFPGDQKDWAIQLYRSVLAESGVTFTDDVWEHDLALCLVAGGGLRLLWQMALRKRSGEMSQGDWEWWGEKIRLTGRWLSLDNEF